jgi:recombination protein RecA
MPRGNKPLKEIAAAINAAFGAGTALVGVGAESRSEITEVISTGIDVVDNYVIGVGGLPCGRVVEVYSEEGGGKTSLLLSALGCAQKDGALAALQETENTLQDERLSVFGVDRDSLLLVQPETLEDVLKQQQLTLETMVRGWCGIIGWDSLAATQTDEEIKKGVASEKARDVRAAVISAAYRQIVPLASEKNVCMLVVNQIREKVGVMFGDKYTTPGGHAVKFAATVRLQILGGKAVKRGEAHVGKDVVIMAAKNKVAPPWRKARVRLRYDTGWDNDWTTLEFAKDLQIVEQDADGEALPLVREKLAAVGWDPARITQEMLVDPAAARARKKKGDQDEE